MEGFLGSAYLWVKALHIIFVIFWMAGLFMLPRFFAYHVDYPVGSDEDQAWIDREARLMRIILTPAMIVSWVAGLALVMNIGLAAGGWLHAKLLLVVVLSGFHGTLSKWRKSLAAGDRSRSSRFYRIANEVPALMIISVVILVIVRPF